MNKYMKRKIPAFTMIEVLVIIVLLSTLTVSSTGKIGDLLDRPKDLEVTRDISQYEIAATVLTAESKDFTVDNINKHVDKSLGFSDVTKLSATSNPYNKSYIIDVIDKDHFTVKSIKISKAGETKTEEFKFSRLNGVLVTTDSEGVDTILKQKVVQLAASFSHTLALLEDGTVKAWGNNDDGQLGDGTNEDKLVPTLVPELSNVKQIAAGGFYTVALLEDGTVKAWGNNDYGQLGDGTTVSKLAPTLIPGLSNVKQIAAGDFHTVALLEDGNVKAWGSNSYGQLGDGTTVSKFAPTSIPGLSNVKQLATGSYHAVVLLEDGTVKAWGYNDNGQLGDGTTVDKLIPTLIPGLSNVKQIAAGYYHTLALLEDGTVKAWGYNNRGQLGGGTAEDKLVPTLIPGL